MDITAEAAKRARDQTRVKMGVAFPWRKLKELNDAGLLSVGLVSIYLLAACCALCCGTCLMFNFELSFQLKLNQPRVSQTGLAV